MALVTNPASVNDTLDQIERTRRVFRRVLSMRRQRLELFLVTRVARESQQPYRCEHDRVLPYHSHQPARYVSAFGNLSFRRAYFYQAGHCYCPLDTP